MLLEPRKDSPLITLSALILLGVASTPAFGATYTSRVVFGGYVASENFTQALDGQSSNDFAIFSGRFYLKSTEVGSAGLEVTGDLRDKYDFFNNLNKQLLELTGANTLQAREISVRLPSERPGFSATIGRFPLSDAGAVNVDGAEASYRWNPETRTALFGGLNPKRPDQPYVQFNPDSQVFGTYTLYQPRSDDWAHYFSLTNAAVGQTVQGHLDRAYWFNSTTYHWSNSNQLFAMLYLDFTPRIYFQTAFLSWMQQWAPAFNTTANLTAIDVIEYTRRQGFLELLPPSPYKEASLQLQGHLSRTASINALASWGIREYDGLIRCEVGIGPGFTQFLSPHWQLETLIGARRNFTADEVFVRGSLGYFSRIWELTLDEEFAYQLEAGAMSYHTNVAELGVARYFSRELYGMVSAQLGTRETVNFTAGYFKIGYRFGSDAVPPLRDGAPPRGRL